MGTIDLKKLFYLLSSLTLLRSLQSEVYKGFLSYCGEGPSNTAALPELAIEYMIPLHLINSVQVWNIFPLFHLRIQHSCPFQTLLLLYILKFLCHVLHAYIHWQNRGWNLAFHMHTAAGNSKLVYVCEHIFFLKLLESTNHIFFRELELTCPSVQPFHLEWLTVYSINKFLSSIYWNYY